MYKCLKCERLFDEPAVWEETVGEWCGMPAKEETSGCPFCKGSYEETIKCEVCGRDFLREEMETLEVCQHCVDKYRKNFDMCYNISFGQTQEIEINALLASLFEPSDIEQILKEFIRDRWQDVDCSPFIDNCDTSWFGERLVKEVKKNEC